jgi:hypothetical protein
MNDSFFDMPAGFNDADLEMAELTAIGNRSARLRAKGICTHGWTQGYTPTHRQDLKPGEVQCLDCERIFPSQTALDDEITDLLY